MSNDRAGRAADLYLLISCLNAGIFATTASELKKITKIEQFITSAIEMGMIKTDEQIINTIKNFN